MESRNPLFGDEYLTRLSHRMMGGQSVQDGRPDAPTASGGLVNDEAPSKSWWVHVWSGLVMDREAKHRKAMRHAIWLYLFLLLAANRRTGKLFRRISTITAETGFSRRSVQRWLTLLAEKGYINKRSTGRSLQIAITKWRPIVGHRAAPPRGDQIPTNEHGNGSPQR